MVHPLLDPLAERLQADLRTRFPAISVRFVPHDDGIWVCLVADDDVRWGEVATNFVDGEELGIAAQEELLAEVTFEVADNLWPDELTDPWPLCPRHGDHPLQVRVAHGKAAWVCLRDQAVAVRVGDLPSA